MLLDTGVDLFLNHLKLNKVRLSYSSHPKNMLTKFEIQKNIPKYVVTEFLVNLGHSGGH